MYMLLFICFVYVAALHCTNSVCAASKNLRDESIIIPIFAYVT